MTTPTERGQFEAAFDATCNVGYQNDHGLALMIWQAARASQVAAAPQQAAPEQATDWIDKVMDQAQYFASVWAMFGSRYDTGDGREKAKQAKAELRAMLDAAPSPQQRDESKGEAT